jgi:Integrase core domain
MTDNGSAYRSTVHAIACRALEIKHIRTKPYRPRTNGKAENFIRTLLAGWAYGAIYRSSAQRAAALSGWLDFYNRRRPHGSLGHQAPTERLTALQRGAQPRRFLQLGRAEGVSSRTGHSHRAEWERDVVAYASPRSYPRHPPQTADGACWFRPAQTAGQAGSASRSAPCSNALSIASMRRSSTAWA